MDFLKKHYEKVILALVSLLLIGSAVVLMGRLTLGGCEDPGDDTINRAKAEPVDTNSLAHVAAMLDQPRQWAGKGNVPFIPEKWKFDPRTLELSKAGSEEIKTGVVVQVIYELDWFVRFKTFPMEFKSVAAGEGTNATFQINVADDRSSRFVKLGQSWRQAIGGFWEVFQVVKFEKNQVERFNKSTGGKEKVDVSVLTLLRQGSTQIPLTMGQRRLESDPVARYESRTTGARSGEMVKGMSFPYKGRKFKLLDITTRRLLIEDSESGAVYEIRPRSVSGQ